MNLISRRFILVALALILFCYGCSPFVSGQRNYPKTLSPDDPAYVQPESEVETETPGDQPIVLVHGFMDTTSTPWWSYIHGYLQEAGYKESELHYLSFEKVPFLNFHSPVSNAEYLKEKVEEVSEKSGKEVDIIAHSLGGIVARIYVEKMDGAQYVDDLITLGSPHQGTYYSYIWYMYPGARDTVPSSKLLQQLNDGDLAEGVEYTAVWGSLDWAYLRDNGSKLPRQELVSIEESRNVWGGYTTHMGLLHSRDVFNKYVQYLD